MTETPLFIVYRNWRGETAVREVYPKSVYHGITQWHPEPQWFMNAFDVSKGAVRDFAFEDILSAHRSYDEAECSVRIVELQMTIAVGDEFEINDQGIRIRVDNIFAARDRQEPTALLPALPAVAESFSVIELNGPTPGAIWTATATFFRVHCTRVQR